MFWQLKDNNKNLITEKAFQSYDEAKTFADQMGSYFSNSCKPYYVTNNKRVARMINEGLVRGDYRGILLPKLSVDEYVPADPNTDNIVLAFFIKGVSEAVVPFVNFCKYCNGVLDVDYGDSDTIANTFIVYIEMDRENVRMENIASIMEQVKLLSLIDTEDFTLTFPDSNKKFPYSLDLVARYFESRNRKKNMQAQKKAEEEAQHDLEKELAQQNQRDDNDTDEKDIHNESLRLAEMFNG